MPQGPLGERIPFEGVLNCWNDDHDLPDLLLAISRSGKTGRLHFSNPEGDKTLDLQGGKIVFAESSSQDDGLGQYLLRTGKKQDEAELYLPAIYRCFDVFELDFTQRKKGSRNLSNSLGCLK